MALSKSKQRTLIIAGIVLIAIGVALMIGSRSPELILRLSVSSDLFETIEKASRVAATLLYAGLAIVIIGASMLVVGLMGSVLSMSTDNTVNTSGSEHTSRSADLAIEEPRTAKEKVIICSGCEAKLSAGAQFCIKCGQQVVQEAEAADEPTDVEPTEDIICSGCEAKLSAGAQFCIKCGQQVVHESEAADVPTNVEPTEDIICSGCEAKLSAGAQFCTKCGQQVAQEADNGPTKCPECDAEVEKDAKFCAECGSRIEVAAVVG